MINQDILVQTVR